MATDRRVVMRTSVIPTERKSYAAVTGSLEENNFTRAAYNKNVVSSAGRLGGSSKMTDISSTQWQDAWSSLTSGSWEEVTTNWNTYYLIWSGHVGASTTRVQLSSDTDDLQFCYIKNRGSNTVKISLDSDSTYPLKLSSGASTMFRGYSTNLKINEVYVKTASGTSTVEYIIAQ